jgi:ribosomal protein L13E
MNPRSGSIVKQIEDQAAEINRHVHQAASLAIAGDLRRAHAEAETAQGLCRRLKELLGQETRASAPHTSPPPSGR